MVATLTPPFIPNDNPYAEVDRGLFRAIELKLPQAEQADVFCRIGEATVYNFQGIANYSIIGYKVYYWFEQPQEAADYNAFITYIDPENLQETFYFTAMPTVFNPFTIEGYCIEDFVKNVRRLSPNKRMTRQKAFAKYAGDADRLIAMVNEPYAISHVAHQAVFISPDGLPLKGPVNTLRYRGYVLDEGSEDPVALPGWHYADKQYLFTDTAFKDRGQMVEAAQLHFLNEGIEQAKVLLGID